MSTAVVPTPAGHGRISPPAPRVATPVAEVPAWPWRGVRWSVPLAALLIYVVVVTTYRLPLGTAMVALALASLPFQRAPLRLPGFLLVLGALVIWGAAGYTSSMFPDKVWDTVVEDGKLWLIGLVVVNTLRTRAQLRLFIVVALASFALYPLRGALFNYFLYDSTVLGRAHWNFIFENPNDLANVAMLQLSMAVGLLASEPKGWVRKAAAVGVAMLVFLILLTQSRAAFISLAVFGILAFMRGRVRKVPLRHVLLAAVAAVVVVSFAPSTLWERLARLRNVTDSSRLAEVDTEGSAQQRYEIWRVAVGIVRDRPVIGVGRGTYKFAHAEYAGRPEIQSYAYGYRDTHSTYLNIAAETGVIGLTLFMALVVTVVTGAERTIRRARRLLPARAAQLRHLNMGLVAYMLGCAVFGSVVFLVFMQVHIALIVAASLILAADTRRARSDRRDSAPRQRLRTAPRADAAVPVPSTTA